MTENDTSQWQVERRAANDENGGGADILARGVHCGRYPTLTRREWFDFFLSVFFFAVSLAMIANEPEKGIPMAATFGSMVAVVVLRMTRLWRYRRSRFLKVSVGGGSKIRGARWPYLAAGAWIGGLGGIWMWFGWDWAWPLVFAGGLWVACGLAVATVVFLGYLPRSYIQLEPDALIIAERAWRARIPWDQIANVREEEINQYPTLLLYVDKPFEVEPKLYENQWHRFGGIQRQSECKGAQFALSAVDLWVDLPVLTGAIIRYRADRAARAELGVRSLT